MPLPIPPPTPALALRVAFRLVLGLLGLVAAVATAAWLFREPITAFSAGLIGATGWPGLLVAFALTDLVPALPHSAVLLMGHAGGLEGWTCFWAASAGAMVGAASAWSVGRLFGRSAWLRGLLDRYWIGAFLKRYGVAAVALASVTPVPDSLTVIGTGAVGAPLWHPLVGALVRVPKIAVYLWAIEAGWRLGAG